jgi:hypothetical protein
VQLGLVPDSIRRQAFELATEERPPGTHVIELFRWRRTLSAADFVAVAGLAVLAFGARSTWPIYKTATLGASGTCRYGTMAAMSSELAWTMIVAGWVVTVAGLLVSPHPRGRRALSLAACCAVPLLLLTAAAATNVVGIDKDPQSVPALEGWWVFASSATGIFFLAMGLARWALVAAVLLYVPASLYALTRLEGHLDVLLRRI